MTLTFRDATAEDIPFVLDLLRDDALEASREGDDLDYYQTAFEKMQAEAANHLIVGERSGRVIATYQLTFIQGLSLRASRRAQVESVRVDSALRGRGIGARLMQDAMDRARAAGCQLIQLTTNTERTRAHAFYEQLGFTPTHVGYKRNLD